MTYDLIQYGSPLPISSLEAYIAWAQKIPMLSAAEEHDLACALTRDNDLTAAKKLILPHLRFVIRIARGYSGYGLPLADLIQEGNLGLMKAVKRFNPDMGVKLVSFAIHWIKSEIHEFVIRNWRIVKIATTKAQRKLFFNLRKMTQKGWLSFAKKQQIAEDLDVKLSDVQQMEMRLLGGQESSYDSTETYSFDEEGSTHHSAQPIEDDRYDPLALLEQSEWNANLKERLQTALNHLDDRSKNILHARWLNGEKKKHSKALQQNTMYLQNASGNWKKIFSKRLERL